MRRREFIAGLGGAVAWPLAARAQQPALPVVGLLSSESPDLYAAGVVDFLHGLGESGYVEGRNVTIEYRWAQGQLDRLPALAADLVHRQVAVIFANYPSVLAARAATATIPIVFIVGFDPVKEGLVASLRRPGGNLTGATALTIEIGPKRLELLHGLVPAATSIALLLNPTRPGTEADLQEMQLAARTLGVHLHVLRASTERDIEDAFGTLAQLRAGGLVIGADGYFGSRAAQLATLALRYAVPTIFQSREFAAGGGLMSYGGNLTDTFRVAGAYTGRILKGEKPADLPVQQATRIELFINTKTAKALGLTFPLTLLGRADEVIE
jgi:putative tryptophan/tyrosine transport system substrate-binding protein